MNLNIGPEWYTPLFILFFAGMWALVCGILSVWSGWRQLAIRYHCREQITGTSFGLQSAAMSLRPDAFFGLYRVSYGSGLRFIANEDGIRLSILFLFRVGHPPLFIPWSEILVSRERLFRFFPEYIRFTFSEEPPIAMWVRRRLAAKIQQVIGQDWFQEVG